MAEGLGTSLCGLTTVKCALTTFKCTLTTVKCGLITGHMRFDHGQMRQMHDCAAVLYPLYNRAASVWRQVHDKGIATKEGVFRVQAALQNL